MWLSLSEANSKKKTAMKHKLTPMVCIEFGTHAFGGWGELL